MQNLCYNLFESEGKMLEYWVTFLAVLVIGLFFAMVVEVMAK
jgi:hypothetical protein